MISLEEDWPTAFEAQLREATTILLVESPGLVLRGNLKRQWDAATILNAAGRKRVITIHVVDGPVTSDADEGHIVMPVSLDADTEDACGNLVEMINAEFDPARPAMIVAHPNTGVEYPALVRSNFVTGTYGARQARAGATVGGWRLILLTSEARGSRLPVELFEPRLLVMVGAGRPVADVTEAPRLACTVRAPDPAGAAVADMLVSAARELEGQGQLSLSPIDLIGAGPTGDSRSEPASVADTSVTLTMPEASLVERLDVPTVVFAAVGLESTQVQLAVTAFLDRVFKAQASNADRQWKAPDLLALSDQPTSKDHLDRGKFVTALVAVLRPQEPGGRTSDKSDAQRDMGPAVVSIEAPWGAGKSSILRRIEEQLREPSSDAAEPDARPSWRTALERLSAWWKWMRRVDRLGGRVRIGHKLTVRAAAWHLWRRQRIDHAADDLTPARRGGPNRQIIVGFNPWSHQLGEQVWAGLSNDISEAMTSHLCAADATATAVDDNRRERYWFRRNVRHLDRRAVTLTLHRRILSPLFKISLFAAAAPILAQVVAKATDVEIPVSVPIFGQKLAPFIVVLLVTAGLLLMAALHTAVRYWFGRASKFLPPDLFYAPVLGGALLTGSVGEGEDVRDPLHRAAAGQLAARHRWFDEVKSDLRQVGCELVILVDDLDRCSPRRTALVFEAMNELLSTEFERIRFVLAVDARAVAAHLQSAFTSPDKTIGFAMPDDPHVGWSFLRKLVQLPLLVPAVRTDGWSDALDDMLGKVTTRPADRARQAQATTTDIKTTDTRTTDTRTTDTRTTGQKNPGADATSRPDGTTIDALEGDPIVRAVIKERLKARPDCTARELKRLLNVWNFYLRLLDLRGRLVGHEQAVAQARALVVLAEIITRWPALQAHLHRQVGHTRALEILVAAARDDAAWRAALSQTGMAVIDATGTKPPTTEHGTRHSNDAEKTLDALREVLRGYGRDVVALARELL